jgi:hypothetical protein
MNAADSFLTSSRPAHPVEFWRHEPAARPRAGSFVAGVIAAGVLCALVSSIVWHAVGVVLAL